jgi:LPS export ABC transporter protein LptC
MCALASCSIDYGAGPGEGAEPLPTARFLNYRHTLVVRGKRSLELRADKAETYAQDKKTVLSGVVFTEFDPDTGEEIASGRADSAVFWPDTEDAEFSGSVRLSSTRQDAVLEGEYLRWNGREKKLEGRLDRAVTISRSDGSRVSGAGFSADARKRSFAFKENVSGTIVEKEGK